MHSATSLHIIFNFFYRHQNEFAYHFQSLITSQIQYDIIIKTSELRKTKIGVIPELTTLAY